MLARILSGLLVPVILGVVLCLPPDIGGRPTEQPMHIDSPQEKNLAPDYRRFSLSLGLGPTHGSVEDVPVNAFRPSSGDSSRQKTEPRQRRGEKDAIEPEAIQAMAAPKPMRDNAGREASPAAFRNTPATMSYRPQRSAAPAAASNRAMASLNAETFTPHSFPTPPSAPTVDPRQLPAKGIYAWASGESFREKQKELLYDTLVYENKGKSYSVGIMTDWTVDSTFGVSFDLLDSEIISFRPDDQRRNDIDGWRANLHYQATVFDRFVVSGKASYGRIDTTGAGYLAEPGGFFGGLWNEPKHRSSTYGAEARFGYPLIMARDIKILPEIGVSYARVQTKDYQYTYNYTLFPTVIPGQNVTSISMPVSLTVKRDFNFRWGSVTPRLSGGYVRDFKDSSLQVSSFNASAAADVIFDPVTHQPVAMLPMEKKKDFFRFGFGLDLLSSGGWDVRADYARVSGKKYVNNIFRVELGRCF